MHLSLFKPPAFFQYKSVLQSAHNICLIIVLTTAYIFIAVALALKIHRSTQGQQATEGFARRKMVS
jgi:hypothetical protein